jgi:hypothetical protein
MGQKLLVKCTFTFMVSLSGVCAFNLIMCNTQEIISALDVL